MMTSESQLGETARVCDPAPPWPPARFVLLDTEYTAWEGSKARGWSGPNEWRELVEIAAIRVDGATLSEADAFRCLVRPRRNPQLSTYFTALTGIAQTAVDTDGIDAADALPALSRWIGTDPAYCFGLDGKVIEGIVALYDLVPGLFAHEVRDVRRIFLRNGIDLTSYSSGTCTLAFGVEPSHQAHSGLNDARTILQALQLLAKINARTTYELSNDAQSFR